MNMNKKKAKKALAGAPAWMVTYSDLVTLLLTFFVLLMSMANMDPVKFLKVANSMRSAFGIVGKIERVDITPEVINIAPLPEEDMAQRVYKRIQLQLNQLKLNEDITLVLDRGAVVLRVDDTLLFASGQSDILPAAFPMLRKIAEMVRPLPFHLRTEGHTDSVGSAAATLGMHEYVAKKMAAQARRYSLPLLERIYRYLLDTDLDMKTGRIDPSLALETLIARLSAR